VEAKIEVITIPVSDVDRSKAFYIEHVGFSLDVDYHPTANFRVVQLTPAASSCSIQLGIGLTDATAGSVRATVLVVTDIDATRNELIARGVKVSAIRHKFPLEDWKGGWQAGPDSERRDYASFADFADPDGNTWLLQEIGYQSGRLA